MRNYDYIALLSLEWGEGCGVGGGGEREKQLFKPEMQNFGVLSQCTIIQPGRFL